MRESGTRDRQTENEMQQTWTFWAKVWKVTHTLNSKPILAVIGNFCEDDQTGQGTLPFPSYHCIPCVHEEGAKWDAARCTGWRSESVLGSERRFLHSPHQLQDLGSIVCMCPHWDLGRSCLSRLLVTGLPSPSRAELETFDLCSSRPWL